MLVAQPVWTFVIPQTSVLGILQATILEWVAISFSRGSSWPRDWSLVSCIAGRFFTLWAIREAQGKQRHPFPQIKAAQGIHIWVNLVIGWFIYSSNNGFLKLSLCRQCYSMNVINYLHWDFNLMQRWGWV